MSIFIEIRKRCTSKTAWAWSRVFIAEISWRERRQCHGALGNPSWEKAPMSWCARKSLLRERKRQCHGALGNPSWEKAPMYWCVRKSLLKVQCAFLWHVPFFWAFCDMYRSCVHFVTCTVLLCILWHVPIFSCAVPLCVIFIIRLQDEYC